MRTNVVTQSAVPVSPLFCRLCDKLIIVVSNSQAGQLFNKDDFFYEYTNN